MLGNPARNSLLGATLLVVAAVGCSAASSSAEDNSNQDLGTGADEVNAKTKACLPSLACAAPHSPPIATRAFRHARTRLATMQGAPNHRGRDLFVNPGQPQWVIAKFAYGVADKDLEDEDVDIFVQRDCGSTWEKLGTATTGGSRPLLPAAEGIEDGDGRVMFQIPKERELGPGKHRVRLVVAGDQSSVDLFLDVVPPKTPIFISDVDGTLTSSENVEFIKLLTGDLPETHPGAPEALRALAEKGYRPIYVTARPEWLVPRTREFLELHGFPPGIIHTSTSITGAGFGSSAAAFKVDELRALAEAKGLVPSFGFGNMPSDSDAYASASIEPVDHRIFYQIDGAFTGKRIESYTELLPAFTALPAVCK